MDKKWALKHIDPYLAEAKTPFSPPEHTGSGFIVADNQIQEKFSTEQKNEIRADYTRKIQAVMTDTSDIISANNAKSFYEAYRHYFSTADITQI